MKPFEAYVLFHALKLHFTTPSYCFVKYGGKLARDIREFERRKDKVHYARLSRHVDPKGLVISNFLRPTFSGWIGDLSDHDAQTAYQEWSKRQESLMYIFQQEINLLQENLVANLTVSNGQYPYALKMLNQGTLSPETLIIMDNALDVFEGYWRDIADPLVWPKTKATLQKYSKLLTYDKARAKKILVAALKQQQDAHIYSTT